MTNPIDPQRRRLLATTSTLAAASLLNLAASGSALAKVAAPSSSNATGGDSATPFSDIRQIRAGTLDVGYVDVGPANGPVAILLHGWPYDIHAFSDVAPRLTAAGYRVIIPYLRGYGSTRFLSSDTPRNGQQAAIAVDIIALMDALKIERAVIAGFDWGARTADIMAAL